MKSEIEKLIKNVPIVKLNNNLDNDVYVLLEKFNITGSVKIKAVYRMMKQAFDNYELHENKTILEASSGNTAIALAYLGQLYGIKVKIVLPKSTAVGKKKLIESYGAEYVETGGTTDDSVVVRDGIYNENPNLYWVPDQFKNYANMSAHYHLTGSYIRENIGEMDFFAAGLGTSGTLLGTAKYLKEKQPNIKIIAFNPIDKVEGLRNFKGSHLEIPFYEEYKYLIDEIIDIDFEKDAIIGVEKLLLQGYFVGISSGGTYSGLMRYLKDKKGQKGVFIAPDSGSFYFDKLIKYIDKGLFAGSL